MADHEVWGVCSVCREVVIYGDRYVHPCENYHVNTGWAAIANPHNTPWLPGYRFCVSQMSGAATGRKSQAWRMTPRRYSVHYAIDREGHLQHVGGPRPSQDTQASVEALYARERPGSNWYPGCEDEPPCCGPGLEGL